ncbi:zinc-alpha-2-glycoprotein-like, partial [Protobothrops mucrosquamatus]|uniref:zinc-alpha-2-glycoprotein-like n=1 Tax=Protobothrops mucrosquamatus TaxID=103944 RepID=UPI0010FB2F45
SSSWHSLYYSYTFVSEPSQGLPQFSILESMNDQPIAHYDSNTKEYHSLVPWMEKVKKEEPLWEEYTGIAQKAEQDFGRNLVTLQKYYNHSEGFHTLQWRYGCELNNDWLRGGSDQDSYDGRTFISFDKETLSWTAFDVAAQLSKRKLEGEPSVAKHIKYYLEETCIEMLRRRINYGKEALLRKGLDEILWGDVQRKFQISAHHDKAHLCDEPPTVTVMSKAEAIQTETHICRVDGFFPKDIKATWRKYGEIWLQDTLHGLVAPNSDGTYHFWLSIRISPSERNQFQCWVEHGSLKNPLKVVLIVPVPHPLSIIIIVLGAILMVVLIGCGLYLFAKRILVQHSQASPGVRSFSTEYCE